MALQPPPIPVDDARRVEDLYGLDMLLTTPEASLDAVTTELARIFEVPAATISFIDADTQYYKSQLGMPEPFASTRLEPREMSICSYVVGTNDELVVEDLAADDRFKDSEAVTHFGARFYAGVPLRADSGRSVGSLCILDNKPRTISDRERELLRLLAAGVMAQVKLSVASRKLLERTQRMDAELRQAVAVQRYMLPPALVRGRGWRVEHRYRPVVQLGGDFVDIYQNAPDRVTLLIADVTGHGASAALTTATAKTAFTRAAAAADDPATLLTAMQRELAGTTPPGQYLTALAVMYDAATRRALLCSAGHPQPLRIGQRGVEHVEHRNELLLLAEPALDYRHVTTIDLPPGEQLLCYTDGATEASDGDGDMLGADGLRAMVEAQRGGEGVSLDALLSALRRYAADNLRDDVALLTVTAEG